MFYCLYVCDKCGEKEKVSMNVKNTIHYLQSRGWYIGTQRHLCPDCLKEFEAENKKEGK